MFLGGLDISDTILILIIPLSSLSFSLFLFTFILSTSRYHVVSKEIPASFAPITLEWIKTFQSPPQICTIVFTALSMSVPMFAVAVMIYKSRHHPPQLLMFSIFLVIMICGGVAVIGLLAATTVSTLSGMLAQRWNPLSYLANYFITALCYYASAIICFSYVSDDLQHTGEADDRWQLYLATLSLIICSFIMIYPDMTEKTEEELGMIPKAFHITTTTTRTVVGDEKDKEEISLIYVYTAVLYPCVSKSLMFPIHIALIVIGSIMSELVMISQFMKMTHTTIYSTPILNIASLFACIIVSCFAVISFVTMGLACNRQETNRIQNRLRFSFELLLLFCMITGLVIAVIADSSIIPGYAE